MLPLGQYLDAIAALDWHGSTKSAGAEHLVESILTLEHLKPGAIQQRLATMVDELSHGVGDRGIRGRAEPSRGRTRPSRTENEPAEPAKPQAEPQRRRSPKLAQKLSIKVTKW